MKALIKNNKVVQVEEKVFPVHQDLTWLDCPDECQPGWIYENNQLIPPPLEIFAKEDYARYLKNFIDTKAREKDYDDSVSCATYANSNNELWKQEALNFISWRDLCWEYAYNIQQQVETGAMQPPSMDEFLTNIPVLNWS